MTDKQTEPRGDILTAIAKAMASVKKVARDGKNTHDNYNFASIDDFLAMVNPICADAGLLFHMDETAREDFTRKGKYGESAWMRQSFAITVYHISGQSLPPVTRSVEVLRNGAQAYGSAQSYALKQFLRSLLLIPTGDKDDADFSRTDEGEVVNAAPVMSPPRFNAAACRDRMLASLAKRKTKQDITDWWRSESEALGDLKDADAPKFAEVKAAVKAAGEKAADDPARQAPDVDLKDDIIPY